MFEEWRRLPEPFSRYEVSNLGKVRSGNRVLKATPNEKGYPKVSLFGDGRASNNFVHSLVAEAFIGPCPEGHEVNHKDADRSNPTASNLEYLTRLENAEHAVIYGRKERKVSIEEVRRLRSTTTPNKVEARRLGATPKHIRQIRRGINWPESRITRTPQE